MSTSERLRRQCSAARRSAFATTTDRLTDHDPTAHRHAVEIEATVRVSGGELRARSCRLRSLSLGGALVELERLPIGTLVNISFGLPTIDERLSLDAIVRWCSRDGVSVLFDSLRAWEVWVLWRFLAGLDDDEDLEPTKPMLAIVEPPDLPELSVLPDSELDYEFTELSVVPNVSDDPDDEISEITRLYASVALAR